MDIKMGLHQGLHMKQQIVMTQRLQQALKLLQVPTLELEQILRTELQANPLLEEVERDDDEDTEQAEEENQPSEAETTVEVTGEDVDWDEYFKDGFRGAATEQGFDDDDQLERPPAYVPSGRSTCSSSCTSPSPPSVSARSAITSSVASTRTGSWRRR